MEYRVVRHDELYHYGVLGMKWGVRRSSKPDYKSTGIRSAMARRSNEKVDASFKKWGENAKKRDDAITLGKQANAAKIAYEKNMDDKQLKSQYRTATKEYKKALKKNTTYRKGVVRQEVGKDASRKYLSEAKKIKKQLSNDPTNKSLQKQHDSFMSKHDVERANARRAVKVSSKRSQKKASIKRAMTTSLKTAVSSGAIAGGAYVINRYLNNHQVKVNGQSVRFSSRNIKDVIDMTKKVKNFMGYMY